MPKTDPGRVSASSAIVRRFGLPKTRLSRSLRNGEVHAVGFRHNRVLMMAEEVLKLFHLSDELRSRFPHGVFSQFCCIPCSFGTNTYLMKVLIGAVFIQFLNAMSQLLELTGRNLLKRDFGRNAFREIRGIFQLIQGPSNIVDFAGLPT